MSELKVESVVEVAMTPYLIAKSFWNLDSEEQAQFFQCLASESEDAYAELQWLEMTNEVKKLDLKTVRLFLSFTAFAYDYWPQKTESQFVGV